MKVLAGIVIGATLGYCYGIGRDIELRHELITDRNLRTDLINWIVNEGVYLERDEFWPLFSEKAKFINIVAVRST